jgi:hypothetical protein
MPTKTVGTYAPPAPASNKEPQSLKGTNSALPCLWAIRFNIVTLGGKTFPDNGYVKRRGT